MSSFINIYFFAITPIKISVTNIISNISNERLKNIKKTLNWKKAVCRYMCDMKEKS